MADDNKDESLIVRPEIIFELPDAEALVRHGGMSADAADLLLGKNNLFEFGPRRGREFLGPEFRSSVFIGGTQETLDIDAGTLPARGPTESLGGVHKASALIIPTEEQVNAVKTGAPLVVPKLERC